MADWYLAPSLHVGRSEVDARWPNRDRASDGTIGDEDHQGTNSDHNPNARGSVNAWDMDTDGPDVEAVKRAFERHPSAHYWIHNRRIADVDNDWRPIQYTGSNPHILHVHFSIRRTVTAEQDTVPWGLLSIEEDDLTPEQVRAEVIAGVANVLDQMANRSTPTGRQGADDFYAIVRSSVNGHFSQSTNAILNALAAMPRFDPVALVQALVASPEALTALTSAMRDQLPLIPTAREIANAFVDVISGNIHSQPSE